MRMCWPSDNRQPCSAFSCIAVTTASPSGWMAMRGMAALPFKLPRSVGLSPRRTTGWRRCSASAPIRLPLASNARPVTDEGCGSFFNFWPAPVEQMDCLANRAGDQALAFVARVAGDVLHPFRAETRQFRTPCRRRRCAEICHRRRRTRSLCAAASGASANAAPSCTASLRQSDLSATETSRTVPSPSANAAAAPARSKRDANDERIQIALDAARSQQELGGGVTHAAAMQRRPFPTPSRDGRGRETGAGALPLPLRAGVAEAVNTHHEPRHLTQPRNLRSHAAAAGDSDSGR